MGAGWGWGWTAAEEGQPDVHVTFQCMANVGGFARGCGSDGHCCLGWVPTSAAWEIRELGRWLHGFCGFSVLSLFSLLLLQAAAFKPTLTAASARFVSGSACKGCCSALRCNIYLGKKERLQVG